MSNRLPLFIKKDGASEQTIVQMYRGLVGVSTFFPPGTFFPDTTHLLRVQFDGGLGGLMTPNRSHSPANSRQN